VHDPNPGETSPIRQRILAARRARASAGVAAITFLTVISGCLYRLFFRDNPYGIQAVLLMGIVGIVMLNLGRTMKSKRMTELAILRFYKSARFYGSVISVSACLVFCYALVIGPKAEVRARTVIQPAPLPPNTPVAEIIPEPAFPQPPKFPKLELTGVILSGSHSSAIINTKTVRQGDWIEGVRLVEVRENSIVVELEGYRNTISRFALSPFANVGEKTGNTGGSASK
jgi:hypothetical protein